MGLAELERRVVRPTEVAGLVPEWSELARRAAHSPFEHPSWLLPWLAAYGEPYESVLVTWWQDGALKAVAPLAWRRMAARGIAYREATFWGATGTPLRGWVDVVAADDVADMVSLDLARMLERSGDWDLFEYLHLAPESPTLAALGASRAGWWRVDLSGVLHSIEYRLPLPGEAAGWRGWLGPKARHEMRRELRQFERRAGGRLEEVADEAAADEIAVALASLMADRWGPREAYFRRDVSFGAFLRHALASSFAAGTGWALVARDERGIAACLVLLTGRTTTVAVLIAVSPDPLYRSMSLGKCLFAGAIDGAVARGSRWFSFLTEGDYKTSFWRAQAWPVESGFFARGVVGRAVAAHATVRRVAPRRLHDRLAGRREVRYRP